MPQAFCGSKCRDDDDAANECEQKSVVKACKSHCVEKQQRLRCTCCSLNLLLNLIVSSQISMECCLRMSSQEVGLRSLYRSSTATHAWSKCFKPEADALLKIVCKKYAKPFTPAQVTNQLALQPFAKLLSCSAADQ